LPEVTLAYQSRLPYKGDLCLLYLPLVKTISKLVPSIFAQVNAWESATQQGHIRDCDFLITQSVLAAQNIAVNRQSSK
jgi:hypothetical protein